MKSILTAALLCALPVLAAAHEYTVGDIGVHHPFIPETAPMAQTAAGYMTLTNTGTTPDALIAVEADFPRVMMHLSSESDGVATMSHVERLDLAPGASVDFAPGGYHVMFMGLGGTALSDGAKVPATLVFENAGRLDVEFNVQPRKDGEAGHATH